MTISAVSYQPVRSNSPASLDPQVKALEAKMKDWAECPTTDPQTKQAIVGRLQTQLDSLASSIESRHQKLDIYA